MRAMHAIGGMIMNTDKTALVSLKTYAETHNVKYGVLRRMHKSGKFDAVTLVLDKYLAIPANTPLPEMPERATSRDDGRKRYTVYANESEHATVVGVVGADNVIDPRAVAKKRRAAKKLADADANANG